MKPLAALPMSLRPSFEVYDKDGVYSLYHCDVCCGSNTRANDISDAEKALSKAGFRCVTIGDRIEVLPGDTPLAEPVKKAWKAEYEWCASEPKTFAETGFSPLGTGLENENDLF